MRLARTVAISLVLLSPAARAAPSKYAEDFEFLRTTVAKDGAAIRSKKIDWDAACARMKPAFDTCASDAEHVKDVMRLLAVLRDSHTGVTRSSVDAKSLPSKWDGLYGGGLWIGWDRGRLVLQGLMDGHPLRDMAPAGSTIAAIDGEPAWLAMERERRRITEFAGSSSDHSLFASMDNRLLPFGERQQLDVVVLPPGAKPRHVNVLRWGPGGKAFYPLEATLPDGVASADFVIAKMLETPWSKRVGYLRITGSMDAATARAFHPAFDTLRGMEACLLDCRGMGGGGDDFAWEMAGRFFPKGADNGIHGRIEKSGSWQFDGPVVMLQDEQEVSSAETFTWAMSETGRAVSVGRATGGWGIIPAGYQCPSGLVSFRLGVNDRPTPIRRVHTEGIGWPADVTIPRGPVIAARLDPVREVGLAALQVLAAGAKPEKCREAFAGLFAGRTAEFPKTVAALAPVKGLDARALADLAADDLRGQIETEIALLALDDAGPPDVLGARSRLTVLEPRATAAGMKSALERLQQAVKKFAAEGDAQTAFLAMTDRAFGAAEPERKKFLAAHGKSAIARFARERYWK